MRRIALALLASSALVATSSAMAADLIIDTPAPVGVVQASGNWDGAFIGAFGGFSSGELTSDDVDYDGIEISGWMLGLAAGANFTVGEGIVLGVVGDIAWNDIADEEEGYTSGWNASLRGRIGFDGGDFLPYLTAGLAVAGGESTGFENTHLGWTAGAGVEFAVAQDLSIDLQYRYTDYGAELYAVEAGATTHAVTVGLNWHF